MEEKDKDGSVRKELNESGGRKKGRMRERERERKRERERENNIGMTLK